MQREALMSFMETRLGLDPSGVDDDTPLFSSNRLDSFSMVDLLMYIESETGARINPMEVSLDNLDSIGRILWFAERKS